ncbi:AraC family transcriptional regulator [Paenibacillus sp. 1P07SE]|uniref:AraC family transcriptional regulator n=1 Tax=Paenibacillus sp. 1P07SE TaxID=3132209 RepID=UPI0039A6BA2B
MKPWFLDAALDWSDDSIRLNVTPSTLAKRMFFYVQEVGHLSTFSNYFTERENLDSYLIVYTISGRGYLQYRDHTYPIQPGKGFWIDCRNYQNYRADYDTGWELLFVHFYGGASQDYFQQFDQQHLRKRGPVVDLGNDQAIPSSIHKLIQLHRQQNIETELRSSKYITDLLTTLLSHTLTSHHVSDTNITPTYIEDMTSYLEQHYAEKLTLDTLASQFSVSKYHLAREFKRYIGLTPFEYQFNSRMNKAKELLKYSQHSVEEISHLIGIDQVSHFIRLFKKQEDTTPLVYRKMWRK